MNILISTARDVHQALVCARGDFDRILMTENLSESWADEIAASDMAVIALEDPSSAECFGETLLRRGLSKDQVIDFYKVFRLMFPFMAADRVMSNPYIDSYEGIILGPSHAETEIIGEMLRPPAANLAVSSQDLFYDHQTLKHVISEYREKLQNLKYLIVDLCKYNCFNYDVSKSRAAISYYFIGGYHKDGHHFADNKNVDITFDEAINRLMHERYEGVTEETIDLWERLFFINTRNLDRRWFQPFAYMVSPVRDHVVTDEEMQRFNYAPGSVRRRFEDTVAENKKIFLNLLQTAREFQPNVKIYVMQMPTYQETWRKQKPYYLPWKEEMERIIAETQKKISFNYLDWTEHPISKERDCWFDPEHMNDKGAALFTDAVNKLIAGYTSSRY